MKAAVFVGREGSSCNTTRSGPDPDKRSSA
jgi:hypothetical protein